MRALVLTLTAVTAVTPTQQPEQKTPNPQENTLKLRGCTIKMTPSPADAVALADADSQSLGTDAPFFRYIWIEDSDIETLKAMSLAINYTSQASVIVRPTPVIVGETMLLRVDLRNYAPKPEQLEQFLKFWEDYQNDPKFSILITKAILANLKFPDDKVPVVKVKKKVEKKVLKSKGEDKVEWRTELRENVYHPGGDYTYPDDTGRVSKNVPAGTYKVELKFKKVTPGEPVYEVIVVEEFVEVKITDIKDVNLIRIPGQHIDLTRYDTLVGRLRTAAPVVSHSYWMCRHLATFKGKGVFAELYGGRYYEFMLYRRDGKGTDEDRILEDFGIGNIEAGVTAEKLFDKLRSDQRFAIFKSKVTSKPRRGDFFRSPSGREGTGLISITHDLVDEDVDIDVHPIMNLLKFQDAGREGIGEAANGLHKFWITNGQGVLQDAAPQNLVEDSEIPAPYTRRLQCAISCIRCHGIGRADGWKVAENDVKKLLKINPMKLGVDVFGDTTNKGVTTTDTNDRIAGLYAGDPENRVFPRGRDDYAAAVLKATGPWKGSKDQVDVVTLASARLSKVWADRNYQMVTPQTALKELGISPRSPKILGAWMGTEEDTDSQKVLEALLPPVVEEGIYGIVPEDPRVAALRQGIPINRADWDLIYGFVAARVQKSLVALSKEKK